MDEPATLSIDEEKKELYELLRKRLGGEDTKFAFLLAMSYGYVNKARMPLRKKMSWVRASYLNDQDRCLMVAVALAESDEVKPEQANMRAVFAIAEEFARGGIALLREVLESPTDFHQRLITDVLCIEELRTTTVERVE